MSRQNGMDFPGIRRSRRAHPATAKTGCGRRGYTDGALRGCRAAVSGVILCLSLAAFSASAAAANDPTVPWFHATFDGTLRARSRGASNPVRVNGPVRFRPGRLGKALLCGDGAAEVEYSLPGNLRLTAGTISMWVQPVNWTGEKDTFHVFLEAKDPGWLVFYRYYQGGITMLLGRNGREYSAAVSPRFRWETGEWHHLAGVWRPNGLAVYIDGKRVRFKSDPIVPENAARTFRIGDHPWHIPRNGQQTLIDDVRIYPAPLDDKAVALLAAGRNLPSDWRPWPVLQLKGKPDRSAIEVRCDVAGWVGDVGPGRTGTLDVVTGEDKAVSRARVPRFERDAGVAEVPLRGLPPGDYRMRLRVFDEQHRLVVERSTPFTIPEPPVWRGNDIGMKDRVLPPWTPMHTITDAPRPVFECWGRRYTFGPFLHAARSAGMDLLADPGTLECAVENGAPAAIDWSPCTIDERSDTHAILTCTGRGGNLIFYVRHRLEFDGFIWTDLTVTSADGSKPVAVTSLKLSWRMPRAVGSLIHATDLGWYKNTTGRLPEQGWRSPGKKRFTDYFWLGNERGGLAWFRESDRFWTPGPGALSVTPRNDGNVQVTVRFIGKPVRIDSPRTYGFGFMATPVRPRPKNARAWRMSPAKDANIRIIWPNGNLRFYGYTEPLDAAKFRKQVQGLHRQGVRVVPYVNLNYVSAGVPEWLFHQSEWADPGRVATPSDVMAMGFASMGVCPAVREWQDFILYSIRRMIQRYEIDGIYIDCWTPYPSLHPACAWKDEKGRLHPTHPIRAYRNILRRVYALFREMRPDPLLQVHMSSYMVIPILSFTDTTLDGEQFRSSPLRDDYLDLLPPDKFRAEFMGRNWGPVAFFLPEFQTSEYRKSGTTNLAVYLLLHDVNPWPIWSDLKQWSRFYAALDRFGIRDADFLPYWENTAGVRTPQHVKASVFRRRGRALLALVNTGERLENAEITIDPHALDFSRVEKAADALTGRTVALVPPARFTLPLERHGGRLLLLEGPPR